MKTLCEFGPNCRRKRQAHLDAFSHAFPSGPSLLSSLMMQQPSPSSFFTASTSSSSSSSSLSTSSSNLLSAVVSSSKRSKVYSDDEEEDDMIPSHPTKYAKLDPSLPANTYTSLVGSVSSFSAAAATSTSSLSPLSPTPPPATVEDCTGMVRIGALGWLPAYGMGTMPLGITYPTPSLRPSYQEAIRLVHLALDLGVLFFDTADTYCQNGKDLHYVEKLLTQALESYPNRAVANRAVIATKGGMRRLSEKSTGWCHGDTSPAGIERIIRASHEALSGSTRPIQLWQLHHTDDIKNLPATLQKVKELQEQGVITHVGLCNTSLANLKLAQTILPIVSVQNQYSLYARQCAKPEGASGKQAGLLQYCAEQGIAFLPYGVLGGVQARDGRMNLPEDYPAIKRVAAEVGRSSQACILSWMRQRYPTCILHIVGHRTETTLRDVHRGKEIPHLSLTEAQLCLLDTCKKGK